MTRPRLSILDQSVGRVGRPQDESIRDTVDLAVHCEALGFQRFWVSEHHNLPTVVGSAPEIVMAAIAARTSRIRIGSAGVMLPHYAALKVAEQFRVLDALAPGRIDLGVGRAPGGDMRTARLLNPQAGQADDFPRQVLELQAWTTGQALPAGHPGQGVAALPQSDTAPQLWMLGSSGYGAQLAAHYGMPYAFAWFITEGAGAEEALAMYRQQFKPGMTARPQTALCVWALAADTEEEAWFQYRSRERTRIDRLSGRFGPVLPPAEAQRPWSEAEAAEVARQRQRAFVGTGDQVRDRLLALAESVQADELVVITWTWDSAVQRRSCELLARSFGLKGAAGAAGVGGAAA